MSKCTKCGAEINERAKFCKACGSGHKKVHEEFKDKKARVMAEEKKWIRPAAVAAAAVVLLGVIWFAKSVTSSKSMEAQAVSSPLRDSSARLAHARAVTSEGGLVRIPLAVIEDGNAHFFAYAAGGKTITFFLMKSADGIIRTAFDACTACNHARLGYRQEGDHVVCNNCGMGFKPADIGKVTGGCNPIPIGKTVDGQTIVLKAKDLEEGAQYF
jgi:uncharacterized membrane protein